MDGPFDSWPPPPADHPCCLWWDHPNWGKLAGGQYVFTREVREECHECVGFWPLLDEQHGVPKLLDRNAFTKYCYYASTNEDLQASDSPSDYIPMDFEGDEASIKVYKDRERDKRMRRRLHEQYYDSSMFDIFDRIGGTRMPYKKIKQISAADAVNQAYIAAVKSCRPDDIKALFAKGKEDLCPNCLELEDSPNMRRGVVAYAMDNLYGPCPSGSLRADAVESLRLVCSLDGVDVNADTWFTPSDIGPPLVSAVKRFDTEVARILLDAGARTTYPDVVGINDQWCTLVEPGDYPEEYQTALHICIGSSTDATDEEMCVMLKTLIKAGTKDDVLVEVGLGGDDDGTISALEMLEIRPGAWRRRCSGDDDAGTTAIERYPTSIAVLKKAIEACEAKKQSNASKAAGYERTKSHGAKLKEGEPWAQITDLDTSMQRSVSQYLDIYQADLLRRTSKGLKSWPRPPPPPIDYHLIRFCITDLSGTAIHGVALTPSAVLAAFKHVAESEGDMEYLGMQFLRIRDSEQPIIPLLHFYQHAGREDAASAFSYIHPAGKHFGIEEAGKDLPWNSALKRLMQMNVNLWHGDPHESQYFDGFSFDDPDMEGAFAWFEGMTPSRELDLKHIWCTSGENEDLDDPLQSCNAIWMNPGESGKRPHPGRGFTHGDGWAICNKTTYLSPY